LWFETVKQEGPKNFTGDTGDKYGAITTAYLRKHEDSNGCVEREREDYGYGKSAAIFTRV
jgi:hypothetical protein